jgi:hypothetical protein
MQSGIDSCRGEYPHKKAARNYELIKIFVPRTTYKASQFKATTHKETKSIVQYSKVQRVNAAKRIGAFFVPLYK